jgi:hypothetical protein
MKTNNLLILFSLIGIFTSCKNIINSSTNQDNQVFSGGCYNVSNEKIVEVLNLAVDNDKISGTGRRTYMSFNENFDLNISGDKTAEGKYDVTIIAKSTMEGRENISETTYETWHVSGNNLEVINRNSSHYVGKLNFYKVNCDGSSAKDSSLFDGFFGFTDGYAPVIKNGKMGIVNEKWEIVVPCNYRELGNVFEGAVKFYNENTNKYGFILVPENKVLVEAKYVHVTNFSNGLAAVLDDNIGRWGIINKKGEMVQTPKFWSLNFYPSNPYLKLFNEGLANVAIDDAKWGYINTNLETVIPFEYLFADPFKNGMARVNKNGQDWFYIDKTGKCVKDCK